MANLEQSSPRLTELQVRERLNDCDDPKVMEELYSFGLSMSKDALDRVKALEGKASSFAAYGGAVVSLLVATATNWTGHGNPSSSCIAFTAGLCGLCCNVQAVKALLLQKIETVSQDEWLNATCLSDFDLLRRFRIVTLWGAIDSRTRAENSKATRIREAEVWLTSAVTFLVLLLFQVALYANLKGDLAWVVFSPRPVWVACWYLFVKTGWGFGCICGLGFWVAYRLSRRLV